MNGWNGRALNASQAEQIHSSLKITHSRKPLNTPDILYRNVDLRYLSYAKIPTEVLNVNDTSF